MSTWWQVVELLCLCRTESHPENVTYSWYHIEIVWSKSESRPGLRPENIIILKYYFILTILTHHHHPHASQTCPLSTSMDAGEWDAMDGGARMSTWDIIMIILSTKRYYHIIFLLSYSFYYHDNSVDKSDDNVYDFE